jgi:hypothetical protein
MRIESDTDRLAMLRAFGSQFDIAGLSVYGLMQYYDLDTYDINAKRPSLVVRTIDVEHASIGDSVKWDTDEWLIRNIEADETGDLTHLQLEAQ